MTTLCDLYDATAGLVNTDSDKPCPPGERVEFTLALMHMLYAAKLDRCVRAGQPEQAKDCELNIKLFADLETAFDRHVREGASKNVAGAEVLKLMHKIDEAVATAR